ncbi:hypothetical protein [Pseudarthrobacter raffinosi]|uniref:hypothetical protein n=1 Tax=Pseudarthrobacter raffinosi TaxID=2953651 RepID=UPI00208EB05F|nr:MULTISPECIES: hypothetical protein [unclassified Pseudarthrobacter]MCO4250672.1 hypothetical protein [Pseudarthrobacter sp. MDT3-9]MCO4261559.1 hypothetical protein [Pseudarthrobacter sp. MDT3-26]
MTGFYSTGQRAGARGAGFAATLVLAASLAGCGPAATGLQRDTASHLQELVLGVSQAAAANDHAAALTALENLEADLATAAGSGQVSEERRRSIMTSITAVRADLNAAVEAAAAAAKAAEEAAVAAAEAEKAKADAEAAQAAQENTAPVVPEPIPAPAPAPEQAKGAEGKGKNKNG